jgi:5S rRNA maturation endonuclease (ribonuclease M5)
MTVEEVIARLEQQELRPKRAGTGKWEACCPAHDDRKASLSIGVGADDCVLLHCHAECSIEDVLASLNLTAADLFPAPSHLDAPVEYLYSDQHGEIVFKVVRNPGKKFAQARPDGAGGWIWNLQGVERVPYRLPKVLAAVKAGETIHVAEGEKDVEALERAGVVATCNPGGVGKWSDAYSKTLAGASVVVIADADEPGRKHARAVAESLRKHNCTVRIVEAATGKDAHDHLAAGLGVQSFTEQTDTAAEDRDSTSENVTRIRRTLFEDALDVRDAGETIREPAPGTAGLLHAGIATAIWADRGKGKSSVALTLGMAHAAAGGRVAYLDRENAPSLSKARLSTIAEANGWPDLLEQERFVCRHYPAVERWTGEDVAEAIGGLGFTGVIYDSLREFLGQLGLDPDSEKDVTAFFTIFVTPLLQRGLWVLLLDNVGHTEKGRPKGSATKLDAAAQGYQIETTSPFNPEKIGALKITCKRSRYGDEDRVWTMRLGGGLFEVPHTISDSPEAKRAQAASEDRERCRRAAIDVLQSDGPLGRDPLLAAIRKCGVTLPKSARDLLADLASDPASGIEHAPSGYQIEGTLPLAPPAGPGGAGPETPGQGGARATPATPETALESAIHPGPEHRGQGTATPPGPGAAPPTGAARAGQSAQNGHHDQPNADTNTAENSLSQHLHQLNSLPADEAEREWQLLRAEHDRGAATSEHGQVV